MLYSLKCWIRLGHKWVWIQDRLDDGQCMPEGYNSLWLCSRCHLEQYRKRRNC